MSLILAAGVGIIGYRECDLIMSITKKVRVEYFRVVCRKIDGNSNEPDILFDLTKWLSKIDELSLENRTIQYKDEKARLDRMKFNKDYGYWHLEFLKLRETNIPNKAKINSVAEPISLDDDEYIGENVNALYDKEMYILALQRNKFSLSVSAIECYINKIWGSDEGIEIYLRPILPQSAYELVKKKGAYRKIEVRFNDVRHSFFDESAKSPMKEVFKSLREYGCIGAEVSLSMGRSQNDFLNGKTVNDTIDDIYNNKDSFSRAEIHYKDDIDDTIEILDLFADKWHDFIFIVLEKRESIMSGYVFSEMAQKYNSGKEKLKNAIGE